MDEPRGHDHDGARRDAHTVRDVLGQGPPPDRPRGRVEPHRLVQHRHDERLVVEAFVQLRLDDRVLGKQEPRPGEQVRRRLVTREEDRDGLVAHLLIGHAESGLLRTDQPGKEVVGVGAGRPAFRDEAVDEAVDDLVEDRARPAEPARRRDR